MSEDNPEESAEDEARRDSQLDGAIQNSTIISHASKHETKNEPQIQSEPPTARNNGTTATEQNSDTGKDSVTSWFAIPAPLKRLFDRFPLVAYVENELPVRALRKRADNVLYVFTTGEDALSERPSFNPSCLKWQTYLKMAGLRFRTVPSNNHASPSGSLPFLLVQTTGSHAHSEFTSTLSLPHLVPSSRLKKWTRDRIAAGKVQESDDVRYEAYASLLDNLIRKAWLYQLYLHPANEAVVNRLYVRPCSSNLCVQMAIASQLRSAAESEIVKASAKSGSTIRIDKKEIMRDAKKAFEALSTLLGNKPWFFCDGTRQQNHETTRDGPSLFDASVFAYTHLILDFARGGNDGVLGWNENPLKTILERFENLVRHLERILDLYY